MAGRPATKAPAIMSRPLRTGYSGTFDEGGGTSRRIEGEGLGRVDDGCTASGAAWGASGRWFKSSREATAHEDASALSLRVNVRRQVKEPNANRMANPKVRQLAALAKAVDARGAHSEQLRDLAD